MVALRDEAAEAMEGAIAIVGMAGRFPGARDLDELWANLRQGVESVRFLDAAEMRRLGVPEARIADPAWVPAVAMPEGIEEFDAPFFGINPREAEILDPQQRLFLETCWSALEDAGATPDGQEGVVSVYAGATTSTYLLFHLARNPQVLATVDPLQLLVGNAIDSLTTRVSYKLGLKGASHAVQCACSTSLVAVHLACQSLLDQECDLALAGGVSLNLAQRGGYLHQADSILSPDGHCRAFDAAARGTVFGGGAGVVVLKRLEDALAARDTIRAVIRGSAVNNDGAAKVGYTAPSVEGQAGVVAEALSVSGVDPETIGYLEGHGTGTALGDPIEIQALARAFRPATAKTGFCALGTIKANVGHLDIASGVAGLIKAVLTLEHGEIPPLPHFERPNPRADFAASPVYVNRELRPWPRGAAPRRAAVSSFGFGGTNAHVVLEEAPAVAEKRGREGAGRPHLLVWSAKTEAALEGATERLARHLAAHPEADLESVSYTLLAGRRTFAHRRCAVARGGEELPPRALTAFDPVAPHDRPIAFLFPGQGAQHPGMGRGLYDAEPVYREWIDRAAGRLQPLLGLDLRTLLFPAAGGEEEAGRKLGRTRFTQPALFAVEHALARLWLAKGVVPSALLGHSIGEYVAASLAGVFSFEDALELVAERGRLIDELPEGSMLAVPLAEGEALALAAESAGALDLAAVNEPGRSVLAGSAGAIEALAAALAAKGVAARPLRTSHAFHSAAMDPAVEPFVARVRRVRLSPPAIPFVSNVTGAWIRPEEATDPAYWGRHLRSTVRFGDGVAALLAEPGRILLEAGPGTTLSTLAARRGGGRPAIASLPAAGAGGGAAADLDAFTLALGRLWLAGHPLDVEALFAGREPRRVPLPTYPFERHRYWIEAGIEAGAGASAGSAAPAGAPARPAPATPSEGTAGGQELHPRPSLATPFVAPRTELEAEIAGLWRALLGLREVGVDDGFLELGGDSLLATQLLSRLRSDLAVELPLERIFAEPTVAGIAAAVVAARAASVEESELARLLSEIGGLSEEEVERELAAGGVEAGRGGPNG